MNDAGANERRLAAIVFTDVVGYSARMQRDETGTMALVRIDFERMHALCTQHGGEVLKSTGDGLLLCFSSVVQAVACGLQIQKEFGARPADTLQHRMGIHLGDVFRADGDVTGDGVNIAARMETKARPGTICLSQSVYDAVKGKLPMAAEPLGPQQFKNITEPIAVYLVTPGASAPLAAAAKKSRTGWLVGAALVIAVALVVMFWPKPEPKAELKPAVTAPTAPMIADKSIAVLPFTNMSDDKENAYFADGVHEDILTNLANIAALKVISRTSMLQYRGTTKTVRQIGQELGVAYVLEGSVRRAGNKVRVSGQLIRTATDEHLWAKNYDRDLTDIFAIQSEVAHTIVASLNAVLTPQESARLNAQPTTNAEAYEIYLKCRKLMEMAVEPRELLDTALPLLEDAVRQDPKFGAAWALISLFHLQLVYIGDFSATRIELARAALTKAESVTPDDYMVLRAGVSFGNVTRDPAMVIQRRRRIIELFPGRAEAQLAIGAIATNEGNWREALTVFRRAHELDPRNPDTTSPYARLLINLRLYQEAETVLRAQATQSPENLEYQFHLATVPYYSRGSKAELEGFLARLSVELGPQDISLNTFRSMALEPLGDPDRIVQFWDQAGEKWRTGETGRLFGSTAVTAAYLARQDTAAARTLFLTAKADMEKARVQRNGRLGPIQLNQYGRILAGLGEIDAARSALAQARHLNESEPGRSADNKMFIRWHNALFRVAIGEKAEALTELKALLREPYGPNVHQLRYQWEALALRGDPEFETLLNDPANNAPCF